MGRGRPKKDGRYDYVEIIGKYKYFVKVLNVKTINGKSKRKPVRARTLEELDDKVARLLADSAEDDRTLVDATLGQWADRWIEKMLPGTVKPSTLSFYRYMLKYMSDRLRHIRLTELTVSYLQEQFSDLLTHGKLHGKAEAPLSVTTVRSFRATLISCIGAAVEEGLININVAKKTRPPIYTVRREISYLTANEIQRLLAVADSGNYYDATALDSKDISIPYFVRQWAMVIRLALASGMRRGEVFGLTWDDVDTESRTVSVRHNLQGNQLVSPKTTHSRRTINIDIDTAQRLVTWRAYQQKYAEALGEQYNNSLNLLFTNIAGRPANVDNFRQRVFDRMVVKAGIPPTVTFHSLRHTHATQLLAARVDAKTVSKRLGHSSVAFTLQTYTHVLSEMETCAADVMGAILSGKKK